MKKRKLRGYVLPTTYLLITLTIFTGILFMSKSMSNQEGYNYGVPVLKEGTRSVMEETTNDGIISSPVDTTTTNIEVYYYSKDDAEDRQEKSLIYYENTYLPNSGVIYTNENAFEIKSAYDGKVIEVKDDEILGSYVVVEHNENLKTYYYGLDKIEVEKDNEITEGTVLGLSKVNNIAANKTSCLFEAYYKGVTINPESIINANIENYE